MTDAPERIWAVPERNCTVYMSGNSPITAQDGPFYHRRHGAASEYIRADLVEVLEAESLRLREALAWYGEQARLARLIHREGDAGRRNLEADGGSRARAALHNTEANHE